MTRDPVYASELAHDTSGVNVEKYMDAALTSVVEDLMAGEKVSGLTLQSLLDEMVDLPEMVAAQIISHDRTALEHEIERRLRRELEGSDVVTDRAYELATEGEE